MEVICELCSRKPLDVLNNERLRAELPDDLNSCREHIPVVLVSLVLPANGERLARRAPCKKLNVLRD
ncbi:hypothetical protein D3C71_883530 [compost metagenome]